ncbi:MAG: diguanylate cyclase [wastewater metagenome]|nr:diguanylate cyclase [Candidatus Loosdrechtia aerotolerans]
MGKNMILKTFIHKYTYCAVGALIAVNCAVVSIFKLEGIYFGFVVFAFCCTLQFLIKEEEQNKPDDKKLIVIPEDLFHKIMNIIPETVYISRFDGSVKYISDGVEKMIGYRPDEIYRTRNFLLQLVHPDDREKIVQQLRKLQSGSEATIEYRLLRKDGTYTWVSDSLKSIKNEWGNTTHYNGVLVNIDEKKIHDKDLQTLNARVYQLNDMVNHHAVRDSLTNVYNKRYLLVILQNEFNRARVQKKPLSCLLIDIDYLEAIDHTYGYFIGDRILVEVAKCLQKNLNPSGIVSRFGDDEFLVVLPEVGKEELVKISDTLVREIENCTIKDEEKNITISFHVTAGGSTVTEKTKNITDLIEQASKNLFAAKGI